MTDGNDSGRTPEFEFDPMKSLNSMLDSVSKIVENGLSAVVDGLNNVSGGALNLPVDVAETETTVIVKAGPIHGVQPEDIDVSITSDVLTIKGEVRDDESGEGVTYLRRERKTGSFTRSVKIPRAVRGDQAVADFKGGMLTITLPKVEESKPKIINIRSVDA
ncbi:MAG: Hsp20/alpha crystallin family protein [Anaerolineae bacterium]|nr:Hsp20/alpha crystallin family protein [Anaerolineae bacterium]